MLPAGAEKEERGGKKKGRGVDFFFPGAARGKKGKEGGRLSTYTVTYFEAEGPSRGFVGGRMREGEKGGRKGKRVSSASGGRERGKKGEKKEKKKKCTGQKKKDRILSYLESPKSPMSRRKMREREGGRAAHCVEDDPDDGLPRTFWERRGKKKKREGKKRGNHLMPVLAAPSHNAADLKGGEGRKKKKKTKEENLPCGRPVEE